MMLPFAQRRFLGIAMLGTILWGLGASIPLYGQSDSPSPFILMIHTSGGWDPTMVLDDKIGSPYVRQEQGASRGVGRGGIPFVDHAQRSAVKTWFQIYGANAVIVNGLYAPSLEKRSAFGSQFASTPNGRSRPTDFLTYYAASVNPTLVAPHVVFDAPFIPGDYPQVAIKITRARLLEYLSTRGPSGTDDYTEESEAELISFQKSVWSKNLAGLHQESLDADKVRSVYTLAAKESLLRAHLQAANTRLGPQSPSESNFVRNGKLALELFAQGSSVCATIQAGRPGFWDTSTNHFSRQSIAFQSLFASLKTIMDRAAEIGIQDRLLIMVVSDMGKSPQLNAKQGKGPWPYTSALLWGAILKGGTVHGGTDQFLRGQAIDPIFGQASSDTKVLPTMAHIFAAIYLATGVPFKLIVPQDKPLTSILHAQGQGGGLR